MTATLLTNSPFTLKDFLNQKKEEGKLYEFDNGILIPIEAMKNTERIIVDNLNYFFERTDSRKTHRSALFPETDCILNERQMRRPDVAYFTREQIIASSIGEHPIPTFVIEIVSQHDESPYIEKKIQDYFTAGVSLVWLIFPEMKMVKICRSIKESQNYFENEQINASPVIPDFTMMVGDLFKV